MSMYPFRGGPWDGFVIEYGERVAPDDSVQPDAAPSPPEGHYWMNTGGTAYVWADDPADPRQRTSDAHPGGLL